MKQKYWSDLAERRSSGGLAALRAIRGSDLMTSPAAAAAQPIAGLWSLHHHPPPQLLRNPPHRLRHPFLALHHSRHRLQPDYFAAVSSPTSRRGPRSVVSMLRVPKSLFHCSCLYRMSRMSRSFGCQRFCRFWVLYNIVFFRFRRSPFCCSLIDIVRCCSLIANRYPCPSQVCFSKQPEFPQTHPLQQISQLRGLAAIYNTRLVLRLFPQHPQHFL